MKLRVENKTKTMSISRSDYQTDIKAASTKSSDDIDSAKSCRFLNKQKQCRFPALISKQISKPLVVQHLQTISTAVKAFDFKTKQKQCRFPALISKQISKLLLQHLQTISTAVKALDFKIKQKPCQFPALISKQISKPLVHIDSVSSFHNRRLHTLLRYRQR